MNEVLYNVKISTVVFFLLFFLITSCVVIPTPWHKDKISNEEISAITEGMSTKDDVLDKIGEPDFIWEIGEQEHIFVYKWERIQAVWFIVGASPYGQVGGVAGDIGTDEALLILFDETNHVKRIERGTKTSSESYSDFLRRCFYQNKEN